LVVDEVREEINRFYFSKKPLAGVFWFCQNYLLNFGGLFFDQHSRQ
jgi:hypothetical protein